MIDLFDNKIHFLMEVFLSKNGGLKLVVDIEWNSGSSEGGVTVLSIYKEVHG